MSKKNEPISDTNQKPEVSEAEAAAEAVNSGPETAAPEEASSTGDELAAAREESRQNYERYLRAVSDLENYRRRMTREKEELRRHATSSLVEEFMPVLDNLELGLKTAANHPEAANVAQGFQMVADQIRSILDRNGVKELDPQGELFDPHRHESLSHQPHDEVPEGHIVQVVRKGYMLNDRLLRPASVLVSSGPAQQEKS